MTVDTTGGWKVSSYAKHVSTVHVSTDRTNNIGIHLSPTNIHANYAANIDNEGLARNNKFTADDVENRVFFRVKKFQEHDIDVLTYSADGNAHEMKTMKKILELEMQSPVL